MGATLEITGATAPIEISVVTKLFDLFRPTAEVKIEFKGLDYLSKQVPLLWFYKHEAGSSFTLSIRGKPGFCLSMVEYLSGISHPSELEPASRAGLPVGGAPAVSASSQHVVFPLFTRIVDVFRFQNELTVDVTFPETREVRYFVFWQRSEGPRISITVRGKPGFTQAVAGHLQLYTPRLREIFIPHDE